MSQEGILKVPIILLFRGNHFNLFSSHSVCISALIEHNMYINAYVDVYNNILPPCKVIFSSYYTFIVMSLVTIRRHECL